MPILCLLLAQSVDEWVCRLGDEEYAVREEAHRALIERGSFDELRKHLETAHDPEIKDRLEQILRSLTPLVWGSEVAPGKPALIVSADWIYADSQGLRDYLFSDFRLRHELSKSWNLVWQSRMKRAPLQDWSKTPHNQIDFLFVNKEGRVLNVVKGVWTSDAFLNEANFAARAVDADRDEVVKRHHERWDAESRKNDPDRARVSNYEASHRIAFQSAAAVLQEWEPKHVG